MPATVTTVFVDEYGATTVTRWPHQLISLLTFSNLEGPALSATLPNLLRQIDPIRPLIIDLSAIHYADFWGVNFLLAIIERHSKKTILAEVREPLRQLLDLEHLTGVLTITDTVASACAQLAQSAMSKSNVATTVSSDLVEGVFHVA